VFFRTRLVIDRGAGWNSNPRHSSTLISLGQTAESQTVEPGSGVEIEAMAYCLGPRSLALHEHSKSKG